MADDPINITHEYFKRVDAKFDRILDSLENNVSRLPSPKEQVSLLRRDVTRIEHRIDTMDARLTRIEKRLDLVEA
ncbi:MAG: hypothetical protein ACLPPF_02395 [Rhodomicrobium sp.]